MTKERAGSKLRISDKNIHYLAGLMEGEACFHAKRLTKNQIRVAVTLGMTDKDVVYEARQRACDIGTITGPYKRENRKDIWIWTVHKQQDVLALVLRLYPYMGNRRQKKMREMLTAFHEHKIVDLSI